MFNKARIYLFILTLFLCFVCSNQTTFAQTAPTNTFQCYWDTTGIIASCKLQLNCQSGVFPAQGSYCVGLSQSDCQSQPAYSCIQTSCGGSNQPCCSTGSACNTGLGCVNPGSICKTDACGLSNGSQCCNSSPRCIGSNLDCDIRTQLCRTKNCGGDGQSCCDWRINPCDDMDNFYCSNPNNRSQGTCTRRTTNNCGGFNQPCCLGRTCPGNSALSCDPDGYCKSTTGCGATLGANCCPGNTCFRGLGCAFNQCLATQCGDIGKSCCPEDQVIGGCWWGKCSANKCIDDTTRTGPGSGVSFSGGCSNNGVDGIQTAIGCIPFNEATQTVIFLIRWGTMITGGISVLLIIYAGFLITTSQGDPGRLQSGKELMTSAVVGTLLIIFSIFVLRLLGVNILGLF